MKEVIKLVTVLCSVVLLAGCARSAGVDFTRLNKGQLNYNVDTKEFIQKKLGKPTSEGVVTKNEKQFKMIKYAYAGVGEATHEGVTAARSQGFYFFDNKLVGNDFASSWAIDSTDFDESKVSLIKKGSSTVQDVIELLGAPGGEYVYPLANAENEKIIVYFYHEVSVSTFNSIGFHQKSLLLTHDLSGVITKVSYKEVGIK